MIINAGKGPIADGIEGAIHEAEALAVGRFGRLDSMGVGKLWAEGVKAENTRRQDAGNGFFQPRELEQVIQTPFEQKYRALDAYSLFPSNNDIQLGAKTYTLSRRSYTGEALIYKGANSDIPMANLSEVSQTFEVRYIVVGYEGNIFEDLAASFAGRSPMPGRQRAANMAIMRKADRLAWHGDQASKLYGVLDYPWLPKRTSAVDFIKGTSAATLLQELNEIADFSAEHSDDIYQPDTMIVSPRVYNVLAETNMGTGTDTTVLQYFLATNGYIRRIVKSPNLKGIGGADVDGILCYANTPEAIGIPRIAPPTPIPPQVMGVSRKTYVYMPVGSVHMPEVLSNLLTFVPAA